jgi:arginyl-tRNA synthetase
LKKNPNAIAEELSKIINEDSIGDISNIIESANNAGPYLNLKINKKIYTSIFQSLYVDIKKPFSVGKNKTVIFDYI